MLARARCRLTFANVVSCIALFAALGGSAVALDVVPFAKQAGFAKKAGKAKKAKKAKRAGMVDGLSAAREPAANRLLALDSAAKFPASVLPEGAVGPAGPKGDPGAEGAPGERGTDGKDFTVTTTLQPGQTETGTYAAFGGGSSSWTGDSINFRVPMPSALPIGNTHFVGAPNASCPGTPTAPAAARGHLCVYEATSGNRSFLEIRAGDGSSNGAGKTGFYMLFTVPGGGASWTFGSWAVTAP